MMGDTVRTLHAAFGHFEILNPTHIVCICLTLACLNFLYFFLKQKTLKATTRSVRAQALRSFKPTFPKNPDSALKIWSKHQTNFEQSLDQNQGEHSSRTSQPHPHPSPPSSFPATPSHRSDSLVILSHRSDAAAALSHSSGVAPTGALETVACFAAVHTARSGLQYTRPPATPSHRSDSPAIPSHRLDAVPTICGAVFGTVRVGLHTCSRPPAVLSHRSDAAPTKCGAAFVAARVGRQACPRSPAAPSRSDTAGTRGLVSPAFAEPQPPARMWALACVAAKMQHHRILESLEDSFNVTHKGRLYSRYRINKREMAAMNGQHRALSLPAFNPLAASFCFTVSTSRNPRAAAEDLLTWRRFFLPPALAATLQSIPDAAVVLTNGRIHVHCLSLQCAQHLLELNTVRRAGLAFQPCEGLHGSDWRAALDLHRLRLIFPNNGAPCLANSTPASCSRGTDTKRQARTATSTRRGHRSRH